MPSPASTIDVTASARAYRRLWLALGIIAVPFTVVMIGYGWMRLLSFISGGTAFADAQKLDLAGRAGIEILAVCAMLAALGRYRPVLLIAGILGTVLITGFSWNWTPYSAVALLRSMPLDLRMMQMVLVLLMPGLLLVAICSLAVVSRRPASHASIATGIDRFSILVRTRRTSFASLQRSKWLLVPLATALAVAAWYVIHFAVLHAFHSVVSVPIGDMRSVAEFDAYIEAHQGEYAAFLVVAVAGHIAGFTGALLVIRHFRRRLQASADAIAQDPSYAPIVLLRSFADENVGVKPKSAFLRLIRRKRRLEEVIVRQLSKLGPAIAIGLPGEKLPQIGALRAYYSDDKWQAAFEDWAKRAYLIAITAGRTPWSLWEFNYVLSRGLAGKLIVVLPPQASAAERLELWLALEHAAAGTPWQAAFQGCDPLVARAAVFSADGSLTRFTSTDESETDFELAIQLAAVQACARPVPSAGTAAA